jgi:hypothetical protein
VLLEPGKRCLEICLRSRLFVSGDYTNPTYIPTPYNTITYNTFYLLTHATPKLLSPVAKHVHNTHFHTLLLHTAYSNILTATPRQNRLTLTPLSQHHSHLCLVRRVCNMRCFIFAVLTILVVAAESHINAAGEFQQFKQEFGKLYTAAEESHRFSIFTENLKFITAENANGMHNYTLGVNQFSDLTAEEFAKQNTGWAKPDALFGDVPNLGNHTWDGSELPESVDWTTKRHPDQESAVCGLSQQVLCPSSPRMQRWHDERRF